MLNRETTEIENNFENMFFKDENKKRMILSKFDYKNQKYTDMYFCDYSVVDIN